MVNVDLIVTQFITGLSIGAQLFLVAIGLSLIFGVLEVLNFTHGALYMIGAFVAVSMVKGTDILWFTAPRWGFWAAVVAGGIIVAVVGVIIEAGFIRFLYGRRDEILDQLILTFGFVLILTDMVRFIFGSGAYSISQPELLRGTIHFTDNFSITAYRGFLIVASVVVMGALFAVLRFTTVGRLVRATSTDREMAELLGVDVSRLYTGVFFVGAALAGIGGALAAPVQTVSVALGNQVIILAFVVVVIGGLGSFTGAFVGAYIIGVLWAEGSLVVAGAGQLFPFLAMILVLLWKPEGLFGAAEAG